MFHKENGGKMERLNEIRHYIVTKYPDCCLSSNYGDSDFEVEYKDILIEELNNYFWYEHMDLCGCGRPLDCQENIKKYLQVLKDWTDAETGRAIELKQDGLNKAFNVQSVYDNTLLLFLAYVLDSYGFTEHCGGIGGAWITDLGRMYLDVLNEVNFSE